MKNYKKTTLGGVIVFAAGIFNIAHAANQYTVTALSAPQIAHSESTGINASGQVVGWGSGAGGLPQAYYFGSQSSGPLGSFISTDNNDPGDAVGNSGGHAVIYHQGQLTHIASLVEKGAGVSYAQGINNAGQVVGNSGSAAFLYQAGTATWLPNPFGGSSVSAYAISNSGNITGGAATSSGQQAYLYQNGAMLGLGTLGGTNAYGRAVNDLGDVAGDSATSNGELHAFLYANHQMLDIGPAGTTFSNALGINSAGQVVGTYAASFNGFPGGAEFRGFLYSNGVSIDLNSLIDPASGWHIDWASAINDAGQIAATGCNGTGCTALLLTPVPEPSTVLYLVCGLGLLGVVTRGRRVIRG